MRNSLWVLSVAAISALSASGQANGSQFLGNWENVDAGTRGLTRFSVTGTPSGLQGRAFGKCEPADCDWGVAPLNLLGFGIDDRNPSWVMVSWDLGFGLTHLVAHLEGREMLAETYTIFKDQSGRTNFRSSYRLKPQSAVTGQAVPPAQPASPAQPTGTRVYRVGAGVSAPVPIYRQEPAYTESARKAGKEGSVLISLVVGEDGVPRDLRVTRSLDPGLDQNALVAVRKWRFRPAQKDGQPVATESTIEIGYHLLKNPR